MTCENCDISDYAECTCSWCGKDGVNQKMYLQGQDWYHGHCVQKVIEDQIEFEYGESKSDIQTVES